MLLAYWRKLLVDVVKPVLVNACRPVVEAWRELSEERDTLLLLSGERQPADLVRLIHRLRHPYLARQCGSGQGSSSYCLTPLSAQHAEMASSQRQRERLD
jgi:hypothetical protein